MEIFSEVYSCYYQVMRRLLNYEGELNMADISSMVGESAFAESLISIIPKISEGNWELFDIEDDKLTSKLFNKSVTPLSDIEKSYLKAVVSDPRIRLFLSTSQIEGLDKMLADVTPLFDMTFFYYYDQFAEGDCYEDANYQELFKKLLSACKNRQFVEIDYMSKKGNRVHHKFYPARLEYSIKNDKFRVLAIKHNKGKNNQLLTLNLDCIVSVTPTDILIPESFDLNKLIKSTYYKEPVELIIKDERNALERAMLHFANYEKNTTKIDENTYRCLIYYNQAIETELLIEILSFGPMITVIGSERMVSLIKERLTKQAKLM